MTTLQKTIAIAIAAGFIAISVGSTVEAGKRNRGNSKRQTTQRRQHSPQRQQFNQKKNFKQNTFKKQSFQRRNFKQTQNMGQRQMGSKKNIVVIGGGTIGRKNLNQSRGMGQRQLGTKRTFIPKQGKNSLKWEDPSVGRFSQKRMQGYRKKQFGYNKFQPQRKNDNFLMWGKNKKNLQGTYPSRNVFPSRSYKGFDGGQRIGKKYNTRKQNFIPKQQTDNPYVKRQPVQYNNWKIVK